MPARLFRAFFRYRLRRFLREYIAFAAFLSFAATARLIIRRPAGFLSACLFLCHTGRRGHASEVLPHVFSMAAEAFWLAGVHAVCSCQLLPSARHEQSYVDMLICTAMSPF